MAVRPDRPDVILRRANLEDAAAIARVHHESHRETYGPILEPHYAAPGLTERATQWRDWLRQSDLAFVALANNVVIGFIHATEAGMVESGERLPTITTLYLLRAWQGRSIGGTLLALMLDLLHRRGHAVARFGVLPTNARAISFYEAQGATQLGRVISSHGGEPHDDLLFAIAARPLRSGD